MNIGVGPVILAWRNTSRPRTKLRPGESRTNRWLGPQNYQRGSPVDYDPVFIQCFYPSASDPLFCGHNNILHRRND